MPYYYIYVIALTICLLISPINYIGKRPAYLKLFPPFILTTAVVEFIAWQMHKRSQNNLLLYNLFSLLEFVFYLYFFYSVYSDVKIKKIIPGAIVIYTCTTLVNICFGQGRNYFHTYTYILGAIVIIIFGLYYFYKLFQSYPNEKLTRNPSFWIATGLVFYYGCTLPVVGIMNYYPSLSHAATEILLLILNLMNVILYSLFTIAFLCNLNIPKYIS